MTQRVRILVLGLLIALPLLVFAGLSAARDQRDRESNLIDDQVAVARAAAVAADGFLQSDAAAVRALVSLPSIQRHNTDLPTAEAAMRGMFQAFPEVESLGLIGPDGWNLYSLIRHGEVPPHSVYVGDRAYVRQALAENSLVLSPAVLSRVRPGVPVVAIAAPIPSAEGGQSGAVMIGTVALAQLRQVMQGAIPSDSRLGLVVVDSDGQVLIAPGIDTTSARDLISVRSAPAVDAALARRTGFWIGRSEISNTELIIGYAPVPETNWAVLVRQPTELAFGPARTAAAIGIGTLASALALSLAAAWWLATRLARSHHQLELAREQAERGRDRATFLAEAGKRLANTLNYEETLESVARAAVPALADWCVVDLTRDGGTDLRRLAIAHADPDKRALAQALQDRFPADLEKDAGVQQVIRSGEPLLQREITDEQLARAARTDEHLELLRSLRPRSVIIVPLRGRGGVIGSITFAQAESGRRYGPEDLELAQGLADRAGLAVENARLFAEVQAAVHTRDEFLASASHDLKNPLAGVKAQAQLLQRRARRAESVSSADAITSAERINSIVTRATAQLDELLDVARLQLGRPLELEREEMDLVKLARDALAELGESGGHELTIHSSAESLTGQWDPRRLRRVLDNLLDNAVKYSPRGGRIDVSIEREVDGGTAYAVLAIADQGLGIPERDLPGLFQRFRRGSNVVGRIGGTGVGLTSALQIVESHGGILDVSSREGEGTRVVVRLPLASAQSPEQLVAV